MYHALFQSIIAQGIIGWGGTAKTYMDPHDKAQEPLIKVITKAHLNY